MRILEMIAGSRGMGDARSMGEMLRRMGRRGDTMLAHITPEEADMLMQAGGAGTVNPDTGLPEFYIAARDKVERVPEVDMGDIESLNPYSFAPDTPEIKLTRPDQTVSSDFRQERINPDIDFSFGTGRAYQQEPRLYPEVDFTPRPERQVFPTDFATQRLPQYEAVDFGRIPEFRELQDQTAISEPSLAQRAETGLKELQDVLNRYPNLTRAGTAGASILAQALMFNQANKAMRRDIEATRAAAEPFRQAQAEAMGRATGEGLTPEQQQEMEIAQARARQGLGARGTPTGSAAAGILAGQARRARSLARQESFTEALRLANIADQYDRRALEMELARDQQLAQLFAGILGREVQQAQRYQAPVTQPTR